MSTYQGMRWFKCDLQVQTPADATNWRGNTMEHGEAETKNAADAYIRRCYELGLQAIAVTDHNFLSKEFIPVMRHAIDSMAEEFGYRLILFPGFEFEADVGKGCHVLAIFEPDADLNEIDHILTQCGVSPPRVVNGILVKSTKRLPDIIEIVQKRDAEGNQRGLVILPHITSNDGLFDDEKISDWLQREEYLNLNLLAVEVPKPVSQMSAGWQRLFRAGADCDTQWRRERPIACLMSSDAKALKPEEDIHNPLGKRHTWIKMSKPSIEALRQAFLDHQSRIRLPEDIATDTNPAERQHHARILSLAMSGASFVADQSLIFSPNLNCIIGGRGSGKSTLLEYLRLALRKDAGDDVRDDQRTKEKISRIRNTISESAAEVRVRWRSRDGVEDTIVLNMLGGARVEGREVLDLDTFFRGLPVRFFSQQQLTQLTEKERNNLLPLIDDFARANMDVLEAQERELRAEVSRLFEVRRQQTVLQGERTRLEQEVAELNRQRTVRAGLQVAAERHERLRAASKLVERIRADALEQKSLVESAEDFVASHSPLGSVADTWPHGEWFHSLDKSVEQAKDRLLEGVKAAVESYQKQIADLFDKDPVWPAIKQELDQAEAEFLAACTAQGLAPEEVSRIQEIDRSLRTKQAELEGKERKVLELGKEWEPLNVKYGELLRVWQDQFKLRQNAAKKANEIGAELHQKFLDVVVHYSGDRGAFGAIWNRIAPRDGRTSLARQWEVLGDALFEHAAAINAASPWAALEMIMSNPQTAPVAFRDWAGPLKQHLYEAIHPQWEDVNLQRVPDLIDLTLYRADGSRAGSVQQGDLSDGQRNTAALALLLAQGDGPLVIDQPEDELDSSFIYWDLVPMLRRIKDQRQLIFATHNANLPVNGDAELLYALETRGGKGERLAEGGLDRSSVNVAVLDVMEGSAEAFQKRREKYHF